MVCRRGWLHAAVPQPRGGVSDIPTHPLVFGALVMYPKLSRLERQAGACRRSSSLPPFVWCVCAGKEERTHAAQGKMSMIGSGEQGGTYRRCPLTA